MVTAKPYLAGLASLFRNYLTSTVHIQSSNEMHDMLTSWISSRGLESTARSFLAKVDTAPGATMNDTDKKLLKLLPHQGSFYFWYKGQLLFYEARQEDYRYFDQEKITLTSLGRSSYILKDFLQECRSEYLNKIRDKITIFGHRGVQWKRDRVKEARPLSTVILRESEKAPLVADMKDFLNARTRRWYAQRSIPYRRGYLLHGPPGTGKSSFSLSVAGELGLDIYTVSIPAVDDQSLKSLFQELPANCVVLLEDIDAVDSAHSRDSMAATPASGQELSTVTKGVSLSGLLNVLDGVASQEDRILIMTTNHVNALDAALIRPGRVDRTVRFQLVDQDVAMQIFHYMFAQQGDASNQDPHSQPRLGVESQAREFARKIPEGRYSPAQVMSYLLQHRNEPDVALSNLERWVESTNGPIAPVQRRSVSAP
ncbi:uncharacterized protein N7473_011166 [Penicillium subrubescens]|uniref:uncharacterized protein n=1 Tax=Penicillium subrubescens TaxID=1316194 RepID=UPI0025459AF3|nr:uncharacterized protein N7473_011166 [Penicillium subrubescens]KAJ5882732.1 hypothetical protein N7473_011166 [Penicillium subrubescens]